MQNRIITYLVLLAVLTVISSCTSESKSLKLDPRTLDFGEVFLDDNKQLDVIITNRYGKPVQISDLSFSNSAIFTFAGGNTLPIDLANNASHTLSILFMPNQPGDVYEALTIVDDIASRSKMLDLVGYGKPVARMDLNTTTLDFGLVLINTDQTTDLIIENKGTADMNITSVSITGSGASTYSITAGGTLPISVAIGASHTITVNFHPPADILYNAELIISHDAVDQSEPLTIPISGTGTILMPEIVLNQTNNWDFGSAPISFPVFDILQMENTGIDDLHVSNISLLTNTEFQIDHIEDYNGNPISLPITVLPSESAFAYVKFAPTTSNSYADTLTLEHDGTNQSSPITINLTGNGKTAQSQSFNYTGNIVSWTVPVGVTTIRVEAWGAMGGGQAGGKGAHVRGDFVVTPGETLNLIVGETGYVTAQGPAYGAGGGGGSFVYRNASDALPMLVAAGGGGQAEYGCRIAYNGGDGSGTQTTTTGGGTGSTTGGTGGNGGTGGQSIGQFSTGGGGCGWLTDGQNGLLIRNPEGKGGKCPRNGALGGEFTHSSSSYCAGNAGDGGFGGGGGMSDNTGAGGGGGGFNGGGGGTNYISSCQWGSGGGGGSYNGGTNQINDSGINSTHGKIEISY